MLELQRKTVEVGDVHLVVQEADGRIGMKRQMLRGEAFKVDPETERAGLKPAPTSVVMPVEEDEALQVLRLIAYPDYIAALVEWEDKTAPACLETRPMCFEDFWRLPETLLDAWGAAVYELNPHWLRVPEKEAEKKVLSSGSASKNTLNGKRGTRRR
jgi:hypothetical protein